MIEAQSRYLNAIVGEILKARQQGNTLAITPSTAALQIFNDKIQAALRTSSFADPKCNSWYKRDDGVITNNWSSTAVDYQNELSKVQWKDYDVDGTAKDLIITSKKPTHVGQASEEILLSNSSLLLGALGVAAVAGGLFALRPGSTWFRRK